MRSAWIAGALTVAALGAMASPALGAGDVCVSIKGDVKVREGSSVCESDLTSRAIAVRGSTALAEGDDNTATAVNHSRAIADDGDNNTAAAINRSTALAEGDNQTVTVINGETK